MYQKRGDSSSWSSKGQITIFIILGLLVFFAFIFVLQLESKLAKTQLQQQEENAISQLFRKEALRLYVQECLEDQLEEGLILLGEQGRLWDDQPGGTKQFEEGKTGREIDGTRVAYGLQAKEYLAFPHSYPCLAESDRQEDCTYHFPNTSLTYGVLDLKPSSVKNDLRRFLINRTFFCIEQFVQANISSTVEVSASTMDLKLDIFDDLIMVQVDYPLTFSAGGEEFFHLAAFTFLYQTKLNQFLEAGVLSPLAYDYRYIDFNYSRETLSSPEFKYGYEWPAGNCQPENGYYSCSHPLDSRSYTSLGIVLDTQEVDNGDDLFTATAPVGTVLHYAPYSYTMLRQNRPPALDYINRSQCFAEGYDYLALQGDPELGQVNLIPNATDPDEDQPTYTFNAPAFPFPLGISTPRDFSISQAVLNTTRPGYYNVSVAAGDGYLDDGQIVRLLVDRPINLSFALTTPYSILNGTELLPYNSYFPASEKRYWVSREDPVFLNVYFPADSMTSANPLVTLRYGDPGDSETFTAALSFNNPSGGYERIAGRTECYMLPFRRGQTCKLSDYSLDDFLNWDRKLSASSSSPIAASGSSADFVYPHFTTLTPTGTAPLAVDFNITYCGREKVSQSSQVEIGVRECVPHTDPSHPYPYMPGDGRAMYQFQFGLTPDGQTNFADFKLKNTSLSPFLASHTCCATDWTVKENTEICFRDPAPGCFGEATPETRLSRGYVLEKRVRLCDGTRGNICAGNWNAEIVLDDATGQPLCGDNAIDSCRAVPDECSGKVARSYTYRADGTKGICWGENVGCEFFCTTALVDQSGEGITTPDDHCGCAPLAAGSPTDPMGNPGDTGKKCDSNFDGRFTGICDPAGGCVEI